MSDNKPTYGVEYITYVSLVSQADTKKFQSNPTLAAGDVKICRGDGAPANLNTLPVVDADFQTRVKVTISSTEMTEASGKITLHFIDAADAEWCDLMLPIDIDMPVEEPAQGAPPASATEYEMVRYLYTKMRNLKKNDGSFVIVYADDGTTELFKLGISESGGVTQAAEAVSWT